MASKSETTTGGLEAIFFEQRDPLLRFLRARGAVESAEDLLQEVWLRATTQTNGPIANPKSYLFRIANNLIIDEYRADTQRRVRERDWSDVNDKGFEGMSDEPSVEHSLVARESLARAQQAIDDLGEPTKTIFRRFRLDGVAQRQIASEMAISLASVEKHLQKAYKAMVALKKTWEAE